MIKYVKEFVRSDIGKILLSIIGVFLVLGVLYTAFYPSEGERLEDVQASVSDLFQDENQRILKTDVTQENIQQATSAINKLPRNKRSEWEAIINNAQDQFTVLSDLSHVFVGNPLFEEGQPHIKQDVTSEQINEVTKRLSQKNSAYLNRANELLSQAPELLNEFDTVRSELEEFTSIKTVTRSNLYDVILLANSLTDKVSVYSEQPYLASDIEAYDRAMDQLATAIINGYSYGQYEQLVINEIFNNPVLSHRLKGTPLNPSPRIALTFDDGPNHEFTPQILEILAENGVKATFFVYGAYVDENPEVARRIVDEGHIIANHSYSHPDFSQIPDEEVLQEIMWTQESIIDATGYEPTMYRMPFGAGGPRVVRLLPELTSIIWNVDSLDWELQDANLIYQNVMSNLSNDMLVLMHDTAQYTVDAVARFIPELVEQGYEFVTPMEVNFQHRFFGE